MPGLIRLSSAALALGIAANAWAQSALPVPEVRIDVKRFVIEGENPISESDAQAILRPYTGDARDLDSLEAAAEALEKVLRAQGYSFHRVIVPAQKPAGGEVKLQVLQFVIDKVVVSGNENFSAESYRRSLPSVQEGQAPDTRAIARELAAANEHPSKRMSLVIKEGENPDVIDAEIRARDVPPVQTFMGLSYASRDMDNTNNAATGNMRLTVGHQRSNLFDRDHALTVAYTTSPIPTSNLLDVMQFSGFYWIPLYGYNSTVSFWATYSNVDSGTLNQGGQAFTVTGSGEIVGMRYTYLLPKFLDLTHNLSVSIEDKYYDNRISALGGASLFPPVRARPLTLRYQGRTEQTWGSVSFNADYVSNLRGGGASSETAYAAQAGSPVRDWDAWRYGVDTNFSFSGGFALAGRLRGQWSDRILLAQEQFGVGGPGSVRGIRDRELAGDSGFTLTLEGSAPPLEHGVQPVAFYDFGAVSNRAVGRQGSSAHSMGLGLRWNWQKKLDLSTDLAYVLRNVRPITSGSTFTEEGHVKLYMSLFYRF